MHLMCLSWVQGADVFPPIGEPGSHARHPGKVVWHDLFTAKPAEAVAFYSEVFGWESEPLLVKDLHLILMRSNGYPVACVVERPKVAGEEAEGLWVGYFSTSSIDNTIVDVELAGGRVLVGKGILPGRGDHAICADSQGAIFGLLRTLSGDPGDYFPEPNEFMWSQHFSRDTAAASSFYGRAAAFEIHKDDRFEGRELYILAASGYARAGMSPFPENHQGDRADWIQFIRVESIADVVGKVEQAGGKVAVAPSPDVLEGRLAVITDPTGALLGLLEAVPPESVQSDGKEISQ